MSLIGTIVGLIEDEGTGSLKSLEPNCPGYTRDQIIRALAWAKNQGRIHRVGIIGTGQTRMGIYAPGPADGQAAHEPKDAEYLRPHRGTIPKVASVWELGTL